MKRHEFRAIEAAIASLTNSSDLAIEAAGFKVELEGRHNGKAAAGVKFEPGAMQSLLFLRNSKYALGIGFYKEADEEIKAAEWPEKRALIRAEIPVTLVRHLIEEAVRYTGTVHGEPQRGKDFGAGLVTVWAMGFPTA